MKVTEKRRHNLREIRTQYPDQKDLAEALDMSTAYLSQLLMDPDKKGSRNIGEKKAREIEAILKLPAFSLDAIADQVNDDRAAYRQPTRRLYFGELELAAARGEYTADDIHLLNLLGNRLRTPKRNDDPDP